MTLWEDYLLTRRLMILCRYIKNKEPLGSLFGYGDHYIELSLICDELGFKKEKQRMYYLASPYSHPNKNVRNQRFRLICEIAALLTERGKLIFCPIAHSHPIAQVGKLPTVFSFWAEFDERIISVCDGIIVAQMEGWDKSVGVTAEIAIAKRLGKSIEYLYLPSMTLSNEPGIG